MISRSFEIRFFHKVIEISLLVFCVHACEVLDPDTQLVDQEKKFKEVLQASVEIDFKKDYELKIAKEFGDGAVLFIESGTFSKSLTLQLAKGSELVSSISFLDSADVDYKSQSIYLSSDLGTQFEKEIRIRLPIEGGSVLTSNLHVIYHNYDLESEVLKRGILNSNNFSYSEGFIEFSVERFGVYQLVESKDLENSFEEFETKMMFLPAIEYSETLSDEITFESFSVDLAYSNWSSLIQDDVVLEIEANFKSSPPKECEMFFANSETFQPIFVKRLVSDRLGEFYFTSMLTLTSDDREIIYNSFEERDQNFNFDRPFLFLSCRDSVGRVAYSLVSDEYRVKAAYFAENQALVDVRICDDGNLAEIYFIDEDSDGLGNADESVEVCPGESTINLVSNSLDRNDSDFDNDGIPLSFDDDDNSFKLTFDQNLTDATGRVMIGNVFMWVDFAKKCGSGINDSCNALVRLYGDIDFSDLNYEPGSLNPGNDLFFLREAANPMARDYLVGDSSNPFTGALDGNGKKISKFIFDFGECSLGGVTDALDCEAKGGSWAGINNIGLFGKVNGASISRIYLDGRIIGGTNVGALVGLMASSKISYIHSKGVVDGDINVGGLIGSAIVDQGSFEFFGNHVSSLIRGRNYIGGIVGRAEGEGTSRAKFIGNSIFSSFSINNNQVSGGMAALCFYCDIQQVFTDVNISSLNGSKIEVFYKYGLEMLSFDSFYVQRGSNANESQVGVEVSIGEILSPKNLPGVSAEGQCFGNSADSVETCFAAGGLWLEWEGDFESEVSIPIVP